MKFYINDGVEIELSDEISKNIEIAKDSEFWYENVEYKVQPIQFNVNDVYFMFAELIRTNPNKKIFVHHFEPLANDEYAVYLAIEA